MKQVNKYEEEKEKLETSFKEKGIRINWQPPASSSEDSSSLKDTQQPFDYAESVGEEIANFEDNDGVKETTDELRNAANSSFTPNPEDYLSGKLKTTETSAQAAIEDVVVVNEDNVATGETIGNDGKTAVSDEVISVTESDTTAKNDGVEHSTDDNENIVTIHETLL